MEDLASFIQTLSEKYGLLDFENDVKVDNVTAAVSHFQQRHTATADKEVQDSEYSQDQNGDGLGADHSTNWECLTSFLNNHDLEYNNMRKFRTKLKLPSMTKRRELINGQTLKHDDVEEEAAVQTFNRPESGSSERAVSLANTMQTSDLIQNASFLDELQNPSLSEDVQSTGNMTKGRDSLDDDNNHGQSSLLQEFDLTNRNGEIKDVDVMDFAKEMGLSSLMINECDPQKEDAASWHDAINSDAWFREYCSTTNNVMSSSNSQRSLKAGKELRWDRAAHDILLTSSRSSSSPTGTDQLDAQVEDCHSASASQCGGDPVVVLSRSRCASPDQGSFAAALESVERGRERAAIVNARVEKMLEESDHNHHNHGPVIHNREGGSESIINRSVAHENHNHDVQDVVGRASELRNFGASENHGSVGSLKKRIADMDEGNRLLLTQLDKSRSLLSPSKQPTLFRSSRSSGRSSSDQAARRSQTRRSSEEEGGEHRSDHGDHRNVVSLKPQLDEVSMLSQEKLSSSPHVQVPHSSRADSSRGERDSKPDSRAVSTHDQGDSVHEASDSPHCPGSPQRRASLRNQEIIDHQPPSIASTPVDQLHRVLNMKKDSSRDEVLAGPSLRIRIPNFQQPADHQYGTRNAVGEINQEGEHYSSRDITRLTENHQNQSNIDSLAVSPRDKVHSDQNHHSSDEGSCARRKELSCYNFTSSQWGSEHWTDVEEDEEGATDETTSDPIRMRTPSVGQSKWDRVNNLLCQSGFPTIRCSNVQASDFEEDCHLVLSDVVSNYERREKFVHALLEEGDELRQVEERNHLHIHQLESEWDEAKQKLAASERRAEVAAKAAERTCAALRRDCQKLESANANLMQRCSQLEHACRAKERTLQKLQDKVRESMVKEDRHRNNDKEVYEKLKHKVASAQHTNGEALEPNFLQRDLKPAQIVGIYERQKVTLETEISNLRAENAQLCREICEKENIILNKVLGTEETKNALDLLSSKQQLQIEEKVREINRLENELKERPTIREVEETIRSSSRQEEASRQSQDRARDETYFEKILRQICQLLELEEPSLIVETLESLLVLVSAVPRMEQFVTDVCDVVFCDGQNWSPPSNGEDTGANRTPEAVPGVLKSWLQKLEASSELLSFKDTIVSMLWERAEKNSELEPETSCHVVIGCVKNLIDVEQDYLATKASYRELTSDAEAIVKAEPQKLLHRIVAHFQMLFEVPKLEGVMAVMNSVYITCTEYHNFARALSSMLGLDKEEGPNTIIAAVNSIMSHGRV